jgi:hypothetical protein
LSTLRKVLTAGALAVALASMPAHLSAAEKEAPAHARAAAVDWLSSLWHELAGLFAASTTSQPPGSGGGPSTQGSCAVDPYGGCYGG